MENSSLADGSTVPVHQEPAREAIQNSLELHVRGIEGKRDVIAVNQTSFDYTLPDGHAIQFSFLNGVLSFKDLSASCLIYKDGITKTSGHLEVGSSLEIGSFRILLWDSGSPVSFLKGCTAPYSNDIWALPKGNHAIGRPGKRPNAVSLDHPTVSREHARILGRDDGTYTVLAEASTNPVYLRGTPVEPGKTEDLQHGDLLEVGDLVFRFHQPQGDAEQAASRSCLEVSSLGELSVSVSGNEIPEKAWRTQYVKWLFAHLAFSWDRPLVIEGLVKELWPDSDPEKASANFKFSLATLRQILRSHLPETLQASEVILRSSTTLQLNPDLLSRHDVVALQRLVRGIGLAAQDDESWEKEAQAAVMSYDGPFLTDCDLEWAVDARASLANQVLELARAVLKGLEEKGKWEAVTMVADRALELDRFAQWACLSKMRALRSAGNGDEALRLFEQNSKFWQEESGVDPRAELLEEQQTILAFL